MIAINPVQIMYLSLLSVLSGCAHQSTSSLIPENDITVVNQHSEGKKKTARIETIPVIRVSAQEKKAIQALSWVKTAQVNEDIKKAIENSDFRFWVIATRITTIPGVNFKSQNILSYRCGQKSLPGMGDIIYSKTHQSYYQQALTYAKSYNQKMEKLCLAKVP